MRRLRTSAAAVVLLAAAPVLVACGGSDDSSDGGSGDLELVTPDGTERLDGVVAGCRKSLAGADVLYVAGGEIADADGSAFYFSAPMSSLALPATITLPLPKAGAADDAGGERAVFATTDGAAATGLRPGSTGKVVVTEAACALGSPVRVSVDVHLGADKDGGDDLDVRGDVSVDAIDLETYFKQLLASASASPTP